MNLKQYIDSLPPDKPIDLYKMSKELEIDINKLRTELFDLLDEQDIKGHVNDLDQTFTKGDTEEKHWIKQAKIAYDEKRYEDALTALSEIIDSDEKNVFSWLLYGDSCIRLKQYKRAEQAYHRAIQLDPYNITSWNKHGRALMDQENYDPAEGSFIRALELYPVEPTTWDNLASLYNIINKDETAQKASKKSSKLKNSDL